jgi:hypothetical protein
MNYFYKKVLIVIIVILAAVIIMNKISFQKSSKFGVTFNYEYAQFLGLDPRKVYVALLDDWKFKYIRISAQWNLIEKKQGEYDFKELDWMMDEAGKRGAKIILAVGQKTPRWPECHNPEWVKNVPEKEYRSKLLGFMETVFKRYKNHPALEIWQVENEPFLNFGFPCPHFTEEMLQEELSLAKKIDGNHPTLVTDSGELSSWRKTARAGDLFGTTMYRVIWNEHVGYINYDWIPPFFYRAKLWLNKQVTKNAYVIELQAEPWIPSGSVLDTNLEEQFKSMNLERLKKNISIAERTGFSRTYLWGVEWWYWLQTKNRSEIGDYIKTLPKN